MGEIKAIETEYNGYRFRSRLEARWAVFFDAAGIDYQYEPEGFELGIACYGDSDKYLPDFYLPGLDVYAEVKGSDKALKADIGKMMDAVDFHTTPISDAGLIILGDIPYSDTGEHIPAFDMLSWHKGVVIGRCAFVYGFKQRAPHTFIYSETDERAECGEDDWLGETDVFTGDVGDGPLSASTHCTWLWYGNTSWSIDVYRTMYPYEIARKARFEHGETPKASQIRNASWR